MRLFYKRFGRFTAVFEPDEATLIADLVDSLTLNRGSHSIKVGADLRRYELNAFAPPNPTGSFQFTTTGTTLQTGREPGAH